jgi:hypothetical protein
LLPPCSSVTHRCLHWLAHNSYIQTVAILFTVSYLRRPAIRRRRVEGSRTGAPPVDGANGNVAITSAVEGGPTITISGSPAAGLNARRATAQSNLFVPSPRASGAKQFQFGSPRSSIRSARMSGPLITGFAPSPKNATSSNANQRATGVAPTLPIAISNARSSEVEKSILTPRSPGSPGATTTATSPTGPPPPINGYLTGSNGHGNGHGHLPTSGSTVSMSGRNSLSVGPSRFGTIGGLLAVMENNNGNGNSNGVTGSPPQATHSLYTSSGSPSGRGSLAANIANGQFLSPDRPVDRTRLALLRVTSEHDLSPQQSPLSINSLAPIGNGSPLGAATTTTSNGSHFTYNLTSMPYHPSSTTTTTTTGSTGSPPMQPSLASHGPISPLPLGAPRAPMKLAASISSTAATGKSPTPPTTGRGGPIVTPLPAASVLAAAHGASAASPGRTPKTPHSARSNGSPGRSGQPLLPHTQHIYGGEDTVGPLLSIGSRRTLTAANAIANMLEQANNQTPRTNLNVPASLPSIPPPSSPPVRQ